MTAEGLFFGISVIEPVVLSRKDDSKVYLLDLSAGVLSGLRARVGAESTVRSVLICIVRVRVTILFALHSSTVTKDFRRTTNARDDLGSDKEGPSEGRGRRLKI